LPPATALANTEALVANPRKELPHHARFLLENVIARPACALVFTHIPIAIGRAAKHVNMAHVGSLTFSPPTAFENLGSLLLGDHALHL
jgi:hypothetical protein